MNYKTHKNVYIYHVTFYEDSIGIHNHSHCKGNLLCRCSVCLDCSYGVSLYGWLPGLVCTQVTTCCGQDLTLLPPSHAALTYAYVGSVSYQEIFQNKNYYYNEYFDFPCRIYHILFMAFVVYHCVYVNDVTDHIGYAATPDNSSILKPITTLPCSAPDHHVGHGTR